MRMVTFSASAARNAKFAGDFRSRRREKGEAISFTGKERERERDGDGQASRKHVIQIPSSYPFSQTTSVPLTKGYYVRCRGRRVSCGNKREKLLRERKLE